MLFRLLLILLIFSSTVSANKNTLPDSNGTLVPVGSWYLGLSVGVGALKNPLRGQDNIPLYVLPEFRYYGKRFSVENLDVSFTLYDAPAYSLELVGQQNMDGLLFPGDNRRLMATFTGMIPIRSRDVVETAVELPPLYPDHKSMSYMAGVAARYFGWFDAQVLALTDVSKVHHGYEISLSLGKQYNWKNINFEAQFGATYKSSKLTEYYYNGEYQELFYQDYNYRADSAINPYIQLSAAYDLGNNYFVSGNIRNIWLDDTIHRSPIFEDTHLLTYFIGIKKLF